MPQKKKTFLDYADGMGLPIEVDDPNAMPPLPPPPADLDFNNKAADYFAQAKAAEERANTPQAGPSGFKEHLVSGLRSFMEGMSRPQDPYYGERSRQATAAEEKQALVEHARSLMGLGERQQQMGETARLRRVQEDREKREAGQQDFENKKPVITNIGQGIIGQTPQLGGTTTFENAPGYESPSQKATSANLQRARVTFKGAPNQEVVVSYDTDGTIGEAGRYYGFENGKRVDVTDRVDKQWDPVMTQTFSPEFGANVVQPRRTIGGGGLAPAPQGMMADARETGAALSSIQQLGQLYSPDFVGPAAGRWYNLAQNLPENMVPDFAEAPRGFDVFSAGQAQLTNQMTKLTAGATVSPQEERRMLLELPTSADRPDRWQAKYNIALRRAQVLNSLIQNQMSGMALTLEDIDRMAGIATNKAPQRGGGQPAPPANQRPANTPASSTGDTAQKPRKRLN